MTDETEDLMPTCTVKTLPVEAVREAAARAVELNPDNDPASLFPGRTLALLTDPDHMAVLTGKKWGKVVDLGVRFLDTSNAPLKAKILAYLNKWSDVGNIRFRESSQGEVRITLSGGGYWSYLGTDILGIGSSQPTMSLHGFSLSTSESEYSRVVTHEGGHTLGFPHEHSRKPILDLLDYEKTIAYFQRTQGWSRQTVIQQILTPLPESSIIGSAADVRSIMCYSFSGSVTKSGQPIPGGSTITPGDAELVAKVYPSVAVPPPPPPPPPPEKTAFALTTADVVAGLRAAGWTVTK